MAIELAIMAVGSALSAASKSAAGKAAKRAAKDAASVARINAYWKRLSTARNVGVQREKGRRLMSKQRAAYAYAGVTSEGSPMQVMIDSAQQIEQDAQNILLSGELEARSMEQAASAMEAKGEAADKAAQWDALSTIGSALGASYEKGMWGFAGAGGGTGGSNAPAASTSGGIGGGVYKT